ncbi:ankyrin repeat domain-containing protein [Verrucomicrobia bacterium]|nr:ankyrin repeat domain-containing protein [Verrucomicrobiota bacterium]
MQLVSLKAFHHACESGHFGTVEKFVKQATHPIDAVSVEGWTGLIMACYNQNNEEAKFLVENGANVNATNQNGTTVFMYAKTPIQKFPKKTELLAYLLDHGANINALDNRHKSVLDYVIENGAYELAKWLIKNGACKGLSLGENVSQSR